MDNSVPPLGLPRETPRNSSFVVWVIVAAAAIAALASGYVFLHRAAVSSSGTAEPTAEEKAYASQISVADAKMSIAQNYIGDSIYFLDAKITNHGDKPVSSVQLQLEYTDMLGQVVLRDDARPVTPREAPLKPGITRPFRVSYDHMPADWNQAPPRVTVTRVAF
jgi:hypothetical protein